MATQIGGGLYMPHGYVVINGTAKIGKNVTILQYCTIGDEGAEIEDGVAIGAGSSVIGAVHIGKNAVIGAGAVVVKDIPDNAVAVGVPARVIKIREAAKQP